MVQIKSSDCLYLHSILVIQDGHTHDYRVTIYGNTLTPHKQIFKCLFHVSLLFMADLTPTLHWLKQVRLKQKERAVSCKIDNIFILHTGIVDNCWRLCALS